MALSVYNSGGSGANSIGNLRTIELSANPSNGGTVSGGGMVSDGMTVSVNASPSDKYKLRAWKENGIDVSTEQTYTFLVSESRNLAAEFEVRNSVVWTQVTIPSKSQWVSFANDKFFISKHNVTGLLYSEDGIVWNETNSDVSTTQCDVIYNGELYTTISNDCSSLLFSEDGISWQKEDVGFGGSYISDIIYANGKFYAMGSFGVANSTIGGYGTWDFMYNSYNRNRVNITYGNGRFIIPHRYGEAIEYSNDGETWHESEFPKYSYVYKSIFANGKFLIVTGDDNKILCSNDGINWNESVCNIVPLDIAYGGGIFVAIGANDKYAYSEDSITWHEADYPSSARWGYLAYGNGRFVAADNQKNAIIYSERV